MAEEARRSPAEDSKDEGGSKFKKKQQSSGGLMYRLWRGVFGSSSEDYEKKLQYLSKEEASVHARLKRRAQSSRKRARNIIVASVILEVIAVAYAIMTTRSGNLDWKTRAARVFPMFGLPILSTLIYSTLASFTRMLDRKDQKTLERLRAERQAKIDELKERTNYYTTQQLIQRYDLDPAAKAAAASVLASKLGADSGLKVYLGDESNPNTLLRSISDTEPMKSTGLRNRKQSHIRSNSTGSAALTQFIDQASIDDTADGQEAADQSQRVVEHYKGPTPSDGGWLARAAALLVGEDPTQCYALICGNCHMHNGLSRKEDFPYITYYCPHCHALNGSQQAGDRGAGSSSGPAMSSPPVDSSSSASAGGRAVTGNLETVEELPAGDADAQAN